jgi:hypothetical protein
MKNESYESPTFTEHFEKTTPDVLYHYTPQEGLLGIVEKKKLWATKIQYMNDATEFRLALKMVRKELDRVIGNAHQASERTAAAGFQESLKGIEDINIFAACFCEDGDLLSQWRGYTRGRHGYAIGFDTDVLMQVADRGGFALGPCIYDRNVQSKIVHEVVLQCIKSELDFYTNRRLGFHGPLADILFRYGAFFKDASFQEEREWRLVSRPIVYNDDQLRFRPGSSTIAPYYALPINHEDGLPIRKVVVGPCPHTELSKSAVVALLTRHGDRRPLKGQEVAFSSTIPFRDW